MSGAPQAEWSALGTEYKALLSAHLSGLHCQTLLHNARNKWTHGQW